jgi:hypothetical protein
MEQPRHERKEPLDDESSGDDASGMGVFVVPAAGLLGGLVFFAHAMLLGGPAEDHIGWQTFWGSLAGLFTGGLLVFAVDDYRQFKSVGRHAAEGDRTYTVWRWLRTLDGGVPYILGLLLVLAAAIWVMRDPNWWTSLHDPEAQGA